MLADIALYLRLLDFFFNFLLLGATVEVMFIFIIIFLHSKFYIKQFYRDIEIKVLTSEIFCKMISTSTKLF